MKSVQPPFNHQSNTIHHRKPHGNPLNLPGRHPDLHQLLGLLGVPQRSLDHADAGRFGGADGAGLRCAAGGERNRERNRELVGGEWVVSGLLMDVNGLLMGC